MSPVEQAKKGGLQKCRNTLTVYYKHFNPEHQQLALLGRHYVGMAQRPDASKLANHLVLSIFM